MQAGRPEYHVEDLYRPQEDADVANRSYILRGHNIDPYQSFLTNIYCQLTGDTDIIASSYLRNVLKVKVLVVGAVLIGKGVGFVDANIFR